MNSLKRQQDKEVREDVYFQKEISEIGKKDNRS